MFVSRLIRGAVDSFCGTAQKLYKSKPNEHKQIKGLIGFSVGVLMTLGVHFVIQSTFHEMQNTKQMIIVSVGTWLCIGGAISTQVRCFMLLLIPTFFGKIGRSILLAFAFSLVLKGPVDNMSNNMEEIVRVFSCTSNIAINLTVSRLELMYHPVNDVMRALKVAAYDMQGKFVSFSDAFFPLIITLEENSRVILERASFNAIRGMSELFDRLQNRTSVAFKEFKDGFRNGDQKLKTSQKLSARLYSHCFKMVSIPMNICSTINDKAGKYFTKLGFPFPEFCPPEILEFCDDVREVAEDFDDVYDEMKAAIEKFDQEFEFSLLQSLETHLGSLDIGIVEHLKERVKDEFNYRVKILRLLLSVFNQTMVVLLVAMFLSADRYRRKYLKDLEFDNYYITWYFRKIDARREEQGKNHLLPLSFLEKMELISPTKFKLLASEKRYMKISYFLILPHVITALVLFLVDYSIVYATELVARHAQMHIRSQGEHKLDVGITGTSFLAEQLRKYFDEIHSYRSVDVEISTTECLPRPSKVSHVQTLIVAAIYIAIFLETLLDAYCRRFRSIFCAFCHYKQEKRRILWLYNTRLRKRLLWTAYRARTVQKLVEQNSLKRDDNLLLDLRDNFPKSFGWLRKWRCAKRRCIVCDTYEDENFHLCLDCGHAYCAHCWRFVEKRCIACKPWLEHSDRSSGAVVDQAFQNEKATHDSASELLNDEATPTDNEN